VRAGRRSAATGASTRRGGGGERHRARRPVYPDEIGKTTAREVVTVRVQVSGPITGIHFGDGADAKRGDLLFTIDRRPYRARALLDAAAAALAQNEASVRLARTELARAERLGQSEATTEAGEDGRGAAGRAPQVRRAG